MKKYMMLTVVAAMIGFAIPNVNGQQTQTRQGTQQGTSTQVHGTQQGMSGMMGNQMIGAQITYKEINESDLPSAVKIALEGIISDDDVLKVYQGNDNMYRLEISGDMGEKADVVYFTGNGDLVRQEILQGKSM